MRAVLARLAVFIAAPRISSNDEQGAPRAAFQMERLAKQIGYAALLGYVVAISSVISIVIVAVLALQSAIRPLTAVLTGF
jgi:hypothetical protein